jgi:ergothioneine biosynthesis protein EgtB
MITAVEPSVSNLLQRFGIVRAATMRLIEPLTPEDLMVQSSPDASPVKWHLAHTSWFFETFVLREFLAGYQAFHPDFHWLFNSYYNALGEMPEKKLRSSFSRPPIDAILAYRVHVDAAIARLLESGSVPDEALRRIVLGLEHEQQHQELMATDIKHALFTNPLHPAYIESKSSVGESIAPPIEWISFEGGLTQIGLDLDPADVTAFAFDNETPRHSVFLVPYSLSNRLVTCAEYLAFMEQDGYARPELWLSEGWTKMRDEGWEAPLYWTRDKSTRSGWSVYTLHGTMPLEELSETAVCHLSFFEADAYARWAGCRLPTEFEWEHVASIVTSTTGNFVESDLLHPSTAPSGADLKQIFGDTWEWTSSGYTGYPGYKPLPGALGEYNGKFMSSQVILRGGSCVTPASHIRPTYRNFFPPATRWQFSGLRLAR